MHLGETVLEDFESASSAWSTLRAEADSIAKSNGDESAPAALTVRLSDYLSAVQRNLEELAGSVPAQWPIEPLNAPKHFVIAQAYRGEIAVRSYPDDSRLMIVDRNLLLVLVCVLFYSSRPEPYGSRLAAWMLVHATLVPDAPFPMVEAFYLAAVRADRSLVADILRATTQFLLGHELGHSYVSSHGTHHLRVRACDPEELAGNLGKVTSARFHENGAIYNLIDDGRLPAVLVVPKTNCAWMDELGADLYAGYLVVAGNRATPATGLETFVNYLCVWQQALLVLSLRQLHATQAAGGSHTHPATTIRMDSLLHHIEKLAREFDPSFTSQAITLVGRQYAVTWSRELFHAWAAAAEHFVYTIDSHLIDTRGSKPGSGSHRATGDLDGKTVYLGSFVRFLRECAIPLAQRAARHPKGLLDPKVTGAWDRLLGNYTASIRTNGIKVMTNLADEISRIGMRF